MRLFERHNFNMKREYELIFSNIYLSRIIVRVLSTKVFDTSRLKNRPLIKLPFYRVLSIIFFLQFN